ncbi:hypothetical protein Pve01_24860 [Planomonospora venezuelensis]|nr:hypothetical protein Pve01_24860 [Planomonospora venezuelensis]
MLRALGPLSGAAPPPESEQPASTVGAARRASAAMATLADFFMELTPSQGGDDCLGRMCGEHTPKTNHVVGLM